MRRSLPLVVVVPLLAGLLLSALAGAPAGAQPVAQSPPFLVSQGNVAPQSGPGLVVAPRGEAVYLWFGLCPEFDLCHRAYDSTGAPVADAAPLDTGSPLLDAVPSAAVGADGNLVLVWSEPGLGFERRIVGRRFVFDGAPLGLAFPVAADSAQVYDRPDVAVTPGGDLVVTFERLRFEGYIGEGEERVPVYTGVEIRGAKLSPIGTPRGTHFRVDGDAPDLVSSPTVAAAGGEILFAWESLFGGLDSEEILIRRFSDADPALPLDVERGITESSFRAQRRAPVAAASDQGTFLIAWTDRAGFGEPERVRAQVFDGGDPRFPLPFLIGQGEAASVDGGDGVFAVAWSAELAAGARAVHARRYGALGTPLEPAFQVDAPPGPPGFGGSGRPLTPAIGLFGGPGLDSGLVTGWRHRDEELTYTVLGRRYAGQLPPPPPCVDGSQTMCLGSGDRFEVRTAWATDRGTSGSGQRRELTVDTGYFWFFRDTNVEVVVKVLDGCPANGRFWVFAAGLTDVEVSLTVRDTVTDASRSYRNDQGDPFQPIQDTAAFFCL